MTSTTDPTDRHPMTHPTHPPTHPRIQAPTPPALDLAGVGHRYGTTEVLDSLDLQVEAGSFVAVVGASGCGKSTLLRLLAGLDRPTTGRITVDGAGPDDLRRAGRVGWMAQRPALLPWATVRDNVAMARRIRAATEHPTDPVPSVVDLLTIVGLAAFAGSRPAQLSGGMQQRAALARTLAQDAPLWLMDEPLAALDELTREALADDLVAIWQRVRPTVVWVTHHLGEAVALADRIVVLGPRPARVVADLTVDLDRPHDATSPAAQAIVRDARAALATAAIHARAGVALGGAR